MLDMRLRSLAVGRNVLRSERDKLVAEQMI